MVPGAGFLQNCKAAGLFCKPAPWRAGAPTCYDGFAAGTCPIAARDPAQKNTRRCGCGQAVCPVYKLHSAQRREGAFFVILQARNIKKIYAGRFGTNKVQALSNVSFSVETGEYLAIMGESGSGKTTLLNILAALDKPTSGQVLLGGQDIFSIRESSLSAFRRDNLGFVFQDFNLLDNLNLQDNIFLPLVLANQPYAEMRRRLVPIAMRLGIQDLLDKYPYEVSGGQKQRAAVARALITSPQLVLADEPTGALDSKSTDELLALFEEINREGQTVLMVTHSVKAASHAGRVLFLRDGEVYHQIYRGGMSGNAFYSAISDALTTMMTGGGHNG